MLLKEDILNLARLSTICYFDEDKIHRCYSCERPYNKNTNELVFNYIKNEPIFVHDFESDCQLIVTEYKNYLVVVFRGTESKKDIFTDLNILQEKLDLKNIDLSPKIHAGFLKQFLSVKETITQDIEKYDNIIFCGHSLGGALATISSLYFHFCFNKMKNIKCVTFGSPRVGDNVFSKLFDTVINESIRVVNDNDPVPCFPTKWRFNHVKGLQWLNQDVVKKEIKVWRFYRFLKYTFLNIFGYGYNALEDHGCDNYIEDIINIL